MKTIDITPGLVYAVPANRMYGLAGPRQGYGVGTGAQVRDGQIAVPFKVGRVGKFRWRRSGACTTEIVDDFHTTTIVGSFPDLQKMLGDKRPENKYKSTGGWRRRAGHHVANASWPGYPSGISITHKKFAWLETEAILSPTDIIMPWADFLKRRDEWVFVESEVAAYGARQSELRKQIYAIVEPCIDSFQTRIVKTDVNMRGVSGQRLVFDHPGILFERTYDVQMHITDLPADVQKQIKPMLREMAAIQKKLECAV